MKEGEKQRWLHYKLDVTEWN